MGGIDMERAQITALFSLLLVVFLVSCTANEEMNESTLVDDMTAAGFVVTEGIDVEKDIYHEDIGNFGITVDGIGFSYLYTFLDPLTEDYGYIYEIADTEQLQLYYYHLLDYSYHVNDIVYVYKTESYIFEVYQSSNSNFPGFMRHYEFDANYQYQLLFDETYVHPKIESILAFATEIRYFYNRDDLNENDYPTQIETVDIVAQSNILFEFDEDNDGHFEAYAGSFLYELHNIDDALAIFKSSCNLMMFPASAHTRMVVQYQNYILIIDHSYFQEYEKVLEALFDDVDYQYLTLYDCMD